MAMPAIASGGIAFVVDCPGVAVLWEMSWILRTKRSCTHPGVGLDEIVDSFGIFIMTVKVGVAPVQKKRFYGILYAIETEN